MKKILRAVSILFVMLSLVFVVSGITACGKEDEAESLPEDFYGMYYYTYNNQDYMYYTFNKDNTGKYEFIDEQGDLISYGEFTYSYSDDKIKLKGVRVSTDGDVEENWSRTFECINGTLVDGGQVYQKMTEF